MAQPDLLRQKTSDTDSKILPPKKNPYILNEDSKVLPQKKKPYVFNAEPKIIGKLVVIQALKRIELDGDELDVDSMETYIGIMEAIVILPDQIILKLHGCDAEAFLSSEYFVEIFDKSIKEN